MSAKWLKTSNKQVHQRTTAMGWTPPNPLLTLNDSPFHMSDHMGLFTGR